MQVETAETDVLCIGGGIAGLMAAIRASELGVKVILADKGNTLHSGAGATGNDHFQCYIPEVHGPDVELLVEENYRSPLSIPRERVFIRTWFQKSFDIVKLWDSWGIPMKYRGKYEFAGHALPGRPLMHLKYGGQNQKRILTEQAHKRGVELRNRLTVVDLLTANDTVIGAIGIDTRQDMLVVFRARSVVLATGWCMRLYPSPVPGYLFALASAPECTGDGRAMAYRAGAELVNMERYMRWAGPKYFPRSGKATWVGIFRDPQGKPVGPFLSKPDRKYSDAIADAYTTLFDDYARSGKGPVYMDCSGISDEDFEYMTYWFGHEGNTAMLNHLKEEDIDLRRNPIEFMTYEMRTAGGINYNERCETYLRNLYAAGDESLCFLSGAATFGWIAGENAAGNAKAVAGNRSSGEIKEAAAQKRDLFDSILSRKAGASWPEVNTALQQIMYDYAGSVRSETLLQAGLRHLRRLREKAYNTMIAGNQHELMRCIEVLNLLDLGELVFVSSHERQETRGRYIRSDYPYTNPLLDKLLVVKRVNDKPFTEWRNMSH